VKVDLTDLTCLRCGASMEQDKADATEKAQHKPAYYNLATVKLVCPKCGLEGKLDIETDQDYFEGHVKGQLQVIR
jgi:hypothetical protein